MKRVAFKQRDTSDCGAACLASVLAYYKMKVSVSGLRIKAGTNERGTTLLGLIQTAKALGFDASGVRAGSEDLPLVAYPCIAHVIRGELHHYVVLYRFKSGKLTVMDPAVGRLKAWNYKTFLHQWSGVLMLVSPSVSFQPDREKKNALNRFWQLFKPHSNMLMQAFAGALIYTLMGFSSAIFLQKLIDHVIPNKDAYLLAVAGLFMILIITAQGLIQILKETYLLRTAHLIDQRLIMGYYQHLTRLPQQFFDTMQVGEILSRVGDAVKIRNLVNRIGIDLVINTLTLLCTLILLLHYSWKLTLFMMLLWPIFALIFLLYDKANRQTERGVMERAARFETRMIEFIRASRVWRTYSLSDFFGERVSTAFYRLINEGYRSGNNALLAQGIAVTVSQLAVLSALWIGGDLVMKQEISMGELLSFYALVGYFTAPVVRLIQANKDIQNALIAADRLFDILDMQCATTTGEGAIFLGKEELLSNPLQIKNVSFAYPGNLPLFQNLNMTFYPGKVYALVGESGCGKSTLLDLIQGICRPSSGSIQWGDISLEDVCPMIRNSCIKTAREGEILFEGSILDNMLLKNDPSKIHQAKLLCRQLGFEDFINQQPNAYDQEVGNDGKNLSTGQRQRIVLARLFLHGPRIILLDEATSALDTKAEAPVLRHLQKLVRKGKLVIIVSHRTDLVQVADRVVFLDNGNMIREGTHEELVQAYPSYALMCKAPACQAHYISKD